MNRIQLLRVHSCCHVIKYNHPGKSVSLERPLSSPPVMPTSLTFEPSRDDTPQLRPCKNSPLSAYMQEDVSGLMRHPKKGILKPGLLSILPLIRHSLIHPSGKYLLFYGQIISSVPANLSAFYVVIQQWLKV